MTDVQNMSKIQIRAYVLQLLLPFKSSAIPRDFEVEKCIDELSKINDSGFIITLLLKEISGTGSVYDNVIVLILYSLCEPQVLSKAILSLLSDSGVADTKKLFLINMLREQGQKVDYDFIQACVLNPDEAIDTETKKFLEEAKLSPETQIDFFDFYFTVSADDRQMLVDSIIEDYSGDELANILSPFAYFYPEICVNKKIIEALADSKSYFAYPALRWCSKMCRDEKLAELASKRLKKMQFSGLRDIKNECQIYSGMFEGSSPYGFWFSSADGNSNISCVFARKKTNGAIQTFFTVFNLEYGPVSAFGFDEILKEDFDVILLRFFKSSLNARLPLECGKLLFDTLSARGWSGGHKMPYEFICWRQLTYDIAPYSKDINSLFEENASKKNVSEDVIFKILNSDIFSSWFYEYGTLDEFDAIADELQKTDVFDINKCEVLLKDCVCKLLGRESFKERFVEKIKYQSYILALADMKSTSSSLYSAIFLPDVLSSMLLHIFKRSIYEYFLKRAHVSQGKDTKSVFTLKSRKKEKQELVDSYNFAKNAISVIEEKWT